MKVAALLCLLPVAATAFSPATRSSAGHVIRPATPLAAAKNSSDGGGMTPRKARIVGPVKAVAAALLGAFGLPFARDAPVEPASAATISPHEAFWQAHYEQLIQYKEKYGNCNVPRGWKENTHLAAWVSNQRVQCRLFKEDKMSSMTYERMDMLEELGFE